MIFFRWHEVPAVLWINAINWIIIMAKRLMVLNRFSYSCHIINSTYKVIGNRHGSLSEVLILQCLVDLTQPNLIISILWWIFLHEFFIFLYLLYWDFGKKKWTYIIPIPSGISLKWSNISKFICREKIKWCFVEFVHKFGVKCQIGQVFTIPIKLML